MQYVIACLLVMIIIVEPAHSSLVVSTLTKDGLVVCADKRKIVPNNKSVVDNVEKISILNDDALIWADGAYSEIVDNKTVWDVRDKSLDFFKTKIGQPTRSSLQQYFSFILEDYASIANRYRLKNRSFDLFVFYRGQNNSPQLTAGRIEIKEGKVSFSTFKNPPKMFSSALTTGIGTNSLWDALYDGNNSAFKDLQADTTIMDLLRGTKAPASVDSKTAERVSRTLITRTSTSILKGSETVSPNSDCFLLPNSGKPAKMAAPR
jgi:hypothetical protein